MHFETIRDFEWFNEPEFGFSGGNLTITATAGTNFVQDFRYNINKDNGHFFFVRCRGDFSLDVVWNAAKDRPCCGQNGLMVRVDAENWCKISVIKDDDMQLFLSVSVTQNGYSDLAQIPLNGEPAAVVYRFQAQKGTLRLYFSPNGKSFIPVRQFLFLTDYTSLCAGAYICSPHNEQFKATLTDIKFV